MADKQIQYDAAVLRRALGRHAAESARNYAVALEKKGELEEAAHWQQIAQALRNEDRIAA
jgi:hypothetical protein